MADSVLALEDGIRGGQGRFDLTGLDPVGRKDMIGFERVEDRREPLRPDADGVSRSSQGRAIGGGDKRERLGVVLDLAADRDEDRLVALDRADDVLARDVGCGRKNDRRPIE